MKTKRYFTGKPCKRGHIAERLKSTRKCVLCENEKSRNRVPIWRKRNLEKYKENNRKTQARRLVALKQRTLTGTNMKEIRDFYKNCPRGFHVDHIIPLQSPIVSGLHVIYNLQYLPAHENLLKGLRFDAE